MTRPYAFVVTLCSAGHVPVIARPPDGPAHRLPAPVGVPLGVNAPSGAAVPFEETTQPLPPGSTVALYTDGLVERPGTDIEAQIDVLAHTLDGVLRNAPCGPDALDATAAHLLGSLIPDTATHDDDVTLLLLGVPEPQESPGSAVRRDAQPDRAGLGAQRERGPHVRSAGA
ncbi:SpoIIE family protein phosphatase [Streptomyces sp. NPDC047841]|uniref:PP2C family protein-serine/threonine phosphatase n=1 Tax=Streptomyces sp. NPDC047841 TaxID=3154708 RepID=UPI003452BF53